MIARRACLLALIGCAGPGASTGNGAADVGARGASLPASVGLPGVEVEGRALDARAFAAEASFLFPEETRALGRALLRQHFASREAERLGVVTDAEELATSLQATIDGLAAAAPDGDLESWAQARYGVPWSRVEAGLALRLERNQRFQLCARLWTYQQGQMRVRMLTSRDRQTAADWVRRIETGASSAAMAQASLDPGPAGDGTLPWLPGELPIFTTDTTGAWQEGAVVGPLQIEGESVWRVFEVLERRPAQAELPPRGELMRELREAPISPLEDRAWFSAMLSRYNAREGLPIFTTPDESFVRPPRR